MKNHGGGGNSKVAAIKVSGFKLADKLCDDVEVAHISHKMQEIQAFRDESEANATRLRSIVADYCRPSIITAFKQLDMIADIDSGKFLLQSAEGLRLLHGLNLMINNLQTAPKAFTIFFLELLTKIFTFAKINFCSVNPDALALILNAAKKLVHFVRLSVSAIAKCGSGTSISQAEVYYAILQTGAIAMNYFDLQLTPSEDCEDDADGADKNILTVESDHPFTDETNQLIEMKLEVM